MFSARRNRSGWPCGSSPKCATLAETNSIAESCGGHFREESQTPEGEALRDDEQFSYVAAWQFTGVGKGPILHKEPLLFEHVHPAQRSYK